jgi:single-strand DNA-binding protein
MNHCQITGRLTKDPTVNDTATTKVARFTLAVDRKGKDKGADFISCVAFGKTAEFIEKYFTNGMKANICGHIQTGSYEKDGKKVYTTDVVVEEIEFGESKKQDKPADDFVDVPDEIENELPFN